MKIRTDFVTNSSSSSFVIAFKSFDKFEKEFENIHPTINSLIKNYKKMLIGNGTEIESVIQLNNYFINNYGWKSDQTLDDIFEDDDYLKERYNDWKDKIENGYSLVYHSVDYNDETLYDMFLNCADNETIIVLERE